MQSSSESSITKTMESQVENKNDVQTEVSSVQEEISPLDKRNSNADLTLISPAGKELSEEDKIFVEQFKKRRKQLGYSQADVGIALGELYGEFHTGRFICQFENRRLPARSILNLKPILQKWMDSLASISSVEEEFSDADKNSPRSSNSAGSSWVLARRMLVSH